MLMLTLAASMKRMGNKEEKKPIEKGTRRKKKPCKQQWAARQVDRPAGRASKTPTPKFRYHITRWARQTYPSRTR